MKKFIILVLTFSFFTISTLSYAKADDEINSTSFPISATNGEIGNLQGVGASYKRVYNHTEYVYSSNLGDHPSCKSWVGCDGYWFSQTSKITMSVTISYENYQIKVAASSGGNYGIFVSADVSRLSKVYVYGNSAFDYYDTYIYNDSGQEVAHMVNNYKVYNASKSSYYYKARYAN